MTDELQSIETRRLLSKYQQVSARGYYESSYEISELSKLCSGLLHNLPPHRKLIASVLLDFFDRILNQFDELNEGTISWPVLDAAILQAVNYVAKGGDEADAVRIANAVIDYRRAWCGS